MALKARLDKSGLRVLCGVRDCGTKLCWVLAPIVGGRRVLFFLPGWTRRDDGVWAMTARAVRRVRQGRRPADRSWYSAITLSGSRDERAPRGIIPYCVADRPLEAVCPSCGFRQVLDPDPLNVVLGERGKTLFKSASPHGIAYRLSTPDELRRWRPWRPPQIGEHGA